MDTSQTAVAAVGVRALYQNGAPAAPAHAKLKPAPVAQAPAPQPSAYPVEVIKGDKRDVTKLQD